METFAPLSLTSQLSTVLPTLACLFSSFKIKDGGRRSYDGYQVLRVNATSSMSIDVMRRLFLRDNFDFWSSPSQIRPTDVMICPEQVRNTKFLLDTLKIPYEVMITNVEETINEEQRQMSVRATSSMNWDTYHKLDTINTWLESVTTMYDFASLVNIGTSAEGRKINVLKISKGNNNPPKPAIWIDGGIHAREWISPAVVTFIANELLTSTAQDPAFPLVNLFDWYILPNVNPDGYEYSHSTERMWRKTRSNNEGFLASLFKCKGADPNRNFGYMWGGKGTSNNPCSDIYRGSKAASEVEISSIQNFIVQQQQRNNQKFLLFLTMHSYSQMLFLPWGYDKIRTDDYTELMAVANKAAKALESVYGTRFDVGPSPELLYAAAGGSEDFAKGIGNIKYSYCFELRDTGKSGFILPADQIVPSGVETFAAVRSMAEDMARIYNLAGSNAQKSGRQSRHHNGTHHRFYA